jgi:CRP-like cAMP-binding protein
MAERIAPEGGLVELRLRQTALFRVLAEDAKAMGALAGLCRTLHCKAGDTVVTEGETGDTMFLLGRGSVEVRKRIPHGEEYTVIELSESGEDFFGEQALIEDDQRSATVVCKTDCEFYAFSRREFIELGQRDPRLALLITRQIARVLCRRLRKANDDIVALFSALVDEVAESGGLRGT